MFSFFRKKNRLKKLTLHEINNLYFLIGHSVPKEEKELLADEIMVMFGKLSNKDIMNAIKMMYDNVQEKSGIQLGLLFIRGLKENNFFEYVELVRGLHGKDKRRD